MNQHIIEKLQWTTDKLQELIGGRKIYIWGAGLNGRGFSMALKRNGFKVEAFLDNNLSLQGKKYNDVKILSFESFLQDCSNKERIFIFISIGKLDELEIAIPNNLANAGFLYGKDCLYSSEVSYLQPYVDISGICNLKCIACPQGDTLNPPVKGGFMNTSVYRKIAEKIVKEISFTAYINLFIFGEPFLNSNLADIVAINNELCIGSHISTNLNVNSDSFENVLKTEPLAITISLSGYGGKNYHITHKGANWDLFYGNLQKLAQIRDKYDNGVKLIINYHLNTINADEHELVRKMCEIFNIDLSVINHSVFPDYIMDYIEQKPVSEDTLYSMQLMNPSYDNRMETIRLGGDKKCINISNFPTIMWDGSVITCCSFKRGKLEGNYLTTSLNDLIALRNESSFCAKCVEYSLHRFFQPDIWLRRNHNTIQT